MLDAFVFFFSGCDDHRDLHSFPTRRSSDLAADPKRADAGAPGQAVRRPLAGARVDVERAALEWNLGVDRKSTRLNSSHSQISYAVFCLKKKNLLYEDVSLARVFKNRINFTY